MKKRESQIKLVRIKKIDTHIKVLYELLKKRKHNISNTSLPSFASHIKFVNNHTYRAWYLVKLDDI